MTELQAILDFLTKGGLIAALLLFIAGGIRGWWVYGREVEGLRQQLKAMTEERDFFRTHLLRVTNIAEEAVGRK